MNNLNYLIGMTEDMAIETLINADIVFRVLRRDSVSAMRTNDAVADRVNLEVDDGKVSSATYG